MIPPVWMNMSRGKIVNFEWMCDSNHYTVAEFDKIATTLIKRDIDTALGEGCDTIIGLYLMNGFLQPNSRPAEFILHLNDLKSHAYAAGIKKIILLSGHGETLDNCPFEYIFLDFNLRMLINSYPDLNLLPNFNAKNKKFLFLTGMPNRANRIGLMSKYYDKGLLATAEWSFFGPWAPADKSWCRNYLKHYSDEYYNEFLLNCERCFDDRYHTCKPYYGSYTSAEHPVTWFDVVNTDWVQLPTHIDSKVYSDTLFSIVSEGPNYWAEDYNFITEKTWRTFLHRHPFIFAGQPAQFDYIKKLGFKTFENYLLIKDYAYINDEDQRLDAVVINTEYWLKNMENSLAEIEKDIEHNYQMFFQHVKTQNEIFKVIEHDFKVPFDQITPYINIKGYPDLIRRIPDGI